MISIIGAGPAGCYTGYLLAKAGKEVNVFEEHSQIGKPVQCTGIVTADINKVIKVKKNCILNNIDRARIYSPNHNFVDLKLKEKNLILDRSKFDNYLADLALSKGAKINPNSRFIGYNKRSIILKNKNKIIRIENKGNSFIGADGPVSKVAQKFGIYNNRKFLFGMQARVKLKNDNAVEFYPYIGQFSWVVPENENIVRIGVASYRNVKEDFNYFLKLKNINKKNIIENQGGLIPIHNKKVILQKKNVFLVGDAATQVKATTGGGIIPGLIGAECLADSIINKKDYAKESKNRLGMSLWLHLKLRNIMDKFDEKQWNNLINIFSRKENKKVIGETSRDNIPKILLKLLINEPKLLYFIRYLL